MSAGGKAMTLRLSSWQHVALKSIAAAEGKPISDVVREAIDAYIDARTADSDFQRRIREEIEENQAILDRLATQPTDKAGG